MRAPSIFANADVKIESSIINLYYAHITALRLKALSFILLVVSSSRDGVVAEGVCERASIDKVYLDITEVDSYLCKKVYKIKEEECKY